MKKYSEYIFEAGTDEVGRGCLAGPVVAAAVILKPDFYHPLINDSKKLNSKQRLLLNDIIISNSISYGIAEVSVNEIDKINILNASIKAMHLALDELKIQPEIILVDGNKFYSYKKIPYKCIIKGDSKIISIAAASILAKNYRDNLMVNLSKEFNEYSWNKNMGYGTKKHKEAIKNYGISIHHRKSFKLLDQNLNIF